MTQTVDIKKEVGTVEGGGMGVVSSLSPGSTSKPVLGTKNGLSGGKGQDTNTHRHSTRPFTDPIGCGFYCRTIIIFINYL